MAITCGFFNSKNGDRRYNAEDMSSIFNGIINDGVFQSVGTAFQVKASSGNTITVGIGRCWFNSTWMLNDTILPITMDSTDVLNPRWDAIVVDVDHGEDVRTTTIKKIKGTAASSPQKPTMASTETHHQYPLAYIYRKAGATVINQADITNMIGTSSCPYVNGILEVQNIDKIVAQWQDQWNQWYKNTSSWATQWENWFKNTGAWEKEWNDWFADETTDAGDDMDEFLFQTKQEIDRWFDDLRANLDPSTAATLAAKIADLQQKFDTLASQRAIYDTVDDSSNDPILGSDGSPIMGKVIFDSDGGTTVVQDENRAYYATLPVSGWEGSDDNGYGQVVPCTGMTSGTVLLPPMFVPSGNRATDIEVQKSLGYISMVESLDGQVQVTCWEAKPTVDLNVVFLEGAGASNEGDVSIGATTDTTFPDDMILSTFGGKVTTVPLADLQNAKKNSEDALVQIDENNSRYEDRYARALRTTSEKAANTTIYPDEGSSLSITVNGYTNQAGSGDPSPSNVRPITVGGRKMVEVVFDGSSDEAWSFVTNNTFELQTNGWARPVDSNTKMIGFTDKYPILTAGELYGKNTVGFGMHQNGLLRFNPGNGLNSVTALRQYLGSNPLTVWYEPADESEATGIYVPYITEGAEYSCQCVKVNDYLCDGDTIESNVPSGCDNFVVFDGSEDEAWSLSAQTKVGVLRAFIPAPGGISGSQLSSWLRRGTTSEWDSLTVDDFVSISTNSNINVSIKSDQTTIDEFRQILAANPLTVWYRSTEYTPEKDMPVCLERHENAYKEYRVADMNNSENYPGWYDTSVPGIVGGGIGSVVPGSVCNIVKTGDVRANTTGSGVVYFIPGQLGGLTQTEFKATYPDLVVQVTLPYKTPITYAHDPVKITAAPKSDGTVKVSSETDATVTVGYNKSLVRAFEELQSAVLSLGGTLNV